MYLAVVEIVGAEHAQELAYAQQLVEVCMVVVRVGAEIDVFGEARVNACHALEIDGLRHRPAYVRKATGFDALGFVVGHSLSRLHYAAD